MFVRSKCPFCIFTCCLCLLQIRLWFIIGKMKEVVWPENQFGAQEHTGQRMLSYETFLGFAFLCTVIIYTNYN